ncbi:MAG: hypothetical protein JNM56_32220, partial [Planctomycetia bacterium]|nr:hypothetical protein [Planctomycetia bacterium]
MRRCLPGVFSLVLICCLLAALDGRSQFKEGGQEKRPASPEEKLFKDLQKAYDKLSKLGPGDEEQAWREMQKLQDKFSKAMPDEEEKVLKDLKKFVEQSAQREDDEAGRTRALMDAVDYLFSYLDRNGDAVLNTDEMPARLASQVAGWDRQGDGLIDRGEYRGYLHARLEAMLAGKGLPGPRPPMDAPPTDAPPVDEPRPVVYRAGKLPPDLPAWFAACDTDGDGQVSLYEWRIASGQSLDRFRALDRNDDGFLTI